MSPTNGSGNGYFDPGLGPELPDPSLTAPEGPPIEAGEMRITVRSEYATDQSNPQRWRYVFIYHIRIENVGDDPAQLFWRHWRIHDPVAGEHDVQGEGVVGETPWLAPGDGADDRSADPSAPRRGTRADGVHPGAGQRRP